MGEASLDLAVVPTPDELAAMVAHVDEALDRGAVGVSSSRTILHTLPDGREGPGTFAAVEELVARFHPDVSWDAPGDDRPFASLFDCRRARDILGWTPKRSWRRPEGSP